MSNSCRCGAENHICVNDNDLNRILTKCYTVEKASYIRSHLLALLVGMAIGIFLSLAVL